MVKCSENMLIIYILFDKTAECCKVDPPAIDSAENKKNCEKVDIYVVHHSTIIMGTILKYSCVLSLKISKVLMEIGSM